jgi:hypothetical protein
VAADRPAIVKPISKPLGGLKALRRKPSGGRKRENMTLAEEKALLRHFVKAAGAGADSGECGQ